MEWDWWSRMQGSSSVPKTPRQGKWWANLRDPVWPRRNSRWQRHWPRSFGVLPEVDLNSVHVKTLDEILREREAKKCREQAMSLAPASHSFQEMTRNLQMAHHQEKNPISRVRWSQFNFHGEERNDDEDDGEDVVAMDMAESDHSEEDNAEAEFSSDELCPEEREGDLSEETSTSSLEEEDGNKIDPVEGDIIPEEWEDRDSDKVVQLDDPRVNVGEDQSCLEEGEEEIELLKFSLGDFWPEESNRSADGEQDERFPEGVGESTRSGQESDNKEEAEMQDGLQADVADNQSSYEENDGDIGDVVSSQDESHLGELDSGVDGETVCSPQQEEYEIHDEARNVKGEGETVEQSNLEEDAGDFEKCKKGDNQDMEDLASSLDVLCPEEASGDVCEVTSGSLQYEECQIDQSDERIICSDQGSNNGNALKQSDPQEDLGRENIGGDESYHEEKEKNVKVYVPPDDFCPEDTDPVIGKETQDCRTAQVWKVILDVVKGDKHYDRKTVQQGDLLFDTGDDKDHPQENTEDTDCAEDDICLTQSTRGVDKDISDIHQEEEELKLVPVEESSLSGQGMWNDKGSTLWENGRVDACVSKSFQVEGEENMEVNATDKRGEGYQSVEESSVDTSMEEGKGKSEISEEAPDEGSYEGVSAGDTSSSEGTDREEEQDIRGKGCQGDESPKGGEDDGCLDKSTKEVKASSLDLSQDSYRKKDTDNQSPRTSPSIGQMVDECSGTDVLTDSEETSDTSTTANKPVCAQVEEADKAAVKRKKDVCLPELKELVNAPRALQDEMSYLPTEFSHPVVSNKSETKSRPQTRKRKCEESTAGGVTFLKVRGKRDGLRKTGQESAGQRQARSGKVERHAKVKNKLTSKDASTPDIPEVPQTRPQRQVAVTEGPHRKRGRFCRKPREGGEVIRKLGQAKEMGPGAELGLSRTGNERHDRPRRKAKDGKGKEDPSQKEPARRLKRSRARDDVSVSEGKKLQGSVEQCGQPQEVSDNSRQSQNSRKRARKAEDDILRKVKRPKRNKNDGVSNKNHEGDNTLPPASPKSASGGVTTRSNFSDPGTVMLKKRGPKAKLQSVNPAQPSSNTVAEKAPVLHVAVASDKIEPKENTSIWAAQEKQDTERNVLETTDFECAKKPKGRRDNCASNNYDRRDTCNPLLKPSPGNTSEGVTTRSNSTTGTLVLKKRGRKPKIQPVNLLQRSSNMVAEVLPILHKVVAGDKIKPRECLSVRAAEEGQSTSREVPESPDFEGAKKSKGQKDDCAINSSDQRDDTLVTAPPRKSSGGVTTRSKSTTRTLVLKNRGRKSKLQSVHSVQPSSNTMAEVAQVLYKAVAGDKIKPQENPSAWAAQERQGTKRNVPELPDLAGDNVQKSRAKRTALKKKSYSPVRGPKKRQRRKQDECEVLVDHRPKSASSSFKKQKQILQIKITSPKQKQNVLAHKLPYSFSKTASTEMVDATPGSDQNIVQDAAVNQEGHQVNADQPIPETIRVPYLETFPISGLNVNVEDAREDQNPQRANSDLPHPETGRAPGPNAAPKADRNIFQDVMNSQETEGVDAGLPVTKTGKSPYLDITPESDENARDIRVSHQEVKGAGSHEALSKTSRACYLDTTQQSDQNLVQDVGINLEPEETAGDQLLSKTKGVQTLDATPESAQNFTHVKSISQGLEGTNDHQLVPEATRVPFAKILANQPQVLLPKLSFNISIPLDCISLKKACERRGARERPSKTTTKVKEAQLTTSGQKKVAGTQSLQGFKRPSQLVPPVSDTLADELPSAAAHPQSSSSGGLQVSGQDSRSTLPLVNSERQAEPVRNDSVAEYLDCSGEIIEAPEVAHTVEVTSTEFPPPTTNCTCSEVGSGTQEGVVPCNDLYSQELERVPSESESVTCGRKSSQLYVGEDTLFDYELDNQVQIISSEYESMGPGSTDTTSEDCSELCLSSPPMKVVVTALTRPHSTDDVPLVSLTSAYRQSEAGPEVALAYSHTLPPMQIFLSRMSESQQLAVPLQELASQLSADLLSPELVRLSDTTDGCSASEEVRSPCCPEEAANSDSSGEAVTPTRQETLETEVHGEAAVNQQHQENAKQQAVESCRELALTGDRTTEHSDVGGTAEESSPGETDSKQITDTTVPTVTSPVSHSVPCSVAGPTQPPPVLSSSPVLSALLATMAETSLCVTAPRDVPPVALVRGRNSPENRCENPNVPEGQKTVDSSEMSQNGVSNVCPSPAVLLAAPHLSSDEVSHTAPSHFSDDLSLSLPLPPLGADFGDFPEEDCISLVCDTESFLSDFGDELMESDRKIGETDKRRKPGSPFQRGNQPQGTSGTNNQLGKDGQPQSVLGTPRKHPPLQTVDWSEVAQYQPVSRSLAGGDCPTNDLRTRLIRRDNQSAPVPTAPGRSWTAPAHLQGSADSRPHPPLRNQAIPKGYCYDFVRNGRCLRRACPYIHDRPRPQSGTPQPQCPPSVRKVIIDPQRTPATEQHEDTQNILALVNECSMALNVHQRGGRHSHDQGSEERAEASSLESAGSLESDGSASPAAIFEAAYSLQQCTSWREARDTLLDLCRRRPEVAGCQPVVAELMAKLQGPGAGASPNDGPEVLGEKFGNFVAVFRRYLAENVSDPATNTLKQTLSCLGVSCALLCCNGQRWGQARRILDCLYHHRFPCQGELTQNVLLIQQLLAKHQQPNLQDGYAAPCIKTV